MTATDLLSRILGPTPPRAYALLARQGRGTLEVLTGDVVDSEALADIPLHDESGKPQEVLTLVPFRQVEERGYAAIADEAPLRSLIIRQRDDLDLAAATNRLPAELPAIAGHGFDVSDDDYIATVRDVIDNEIGRGEGANFVIRRDYLAQADGTGAQVALALLRRLLERERGAYWTFAVVTDEVILAGASPERHVSVDQGIATMNPISGTYRHPAGGIDPAEFSQFLMDTKEVEELFMVVDEELKMMSEVCADGGVVEGPFLKQMSRVTHTEYLLRGHTSMDVRDVLRETMFAPTVTGSPMQNACAVIARHETKGRGYYSGVAALMTPEPGGSHSLDAPILIRTAQITPSGGIRVSAGATLVRHSSPEGEVAETAGKAAGLLSALGLEAAYGAGFGVGSGAATSVPAAMIDPAELPVDELSSSASRTVPASGDRTADVRAVAAARNAAPSETVREHSFALQPGSLADDPVIEAALLARNKMLAPFWLAEQHAVGSSVTGRKVLVVDAEDRFTTMLAHQLRHLGMLVEVLPWQEVPADGRAVLTDGTVPDVVVAGPGPGDPLDDADERIVRLRAVVAATQQDNLPLVAVCLSHQVVACGLGLDIVRLDRPRQGVQLPIDYFGTIARIGFYNTFTARIDDAALAGAAGSSTVSHAGMALAVDETSGDVFAIRGPGLATLQGHAESILSIDGLVVLEQMVRHALGVASR